MIARNLEYNDTESGPLARTADVILSATYTVMSVGTLNTLAILKSQANLFFNTQKNNNEDDTSY